MGRDNDRRNQTSRYSRSGKGRGNSSSRRTNNYNNNNKTSTALKQFAPHTTGSNKYATYSTVKDLVCQSIQKTYKNGLDVANSLADGAKVDLTQHKPVRQESTDTNADTKAFEQAGYDIDYQEELKMYLERKQNLEDNLPKAYALIFQT